MFAQLQTWHAIPAAVSAVLSFWALGIYIKEVLSGGEARPNAVSFLLWTILEAIALVAQYRAGASLSAIFVFLVTFNTAVVTVLAFIGYGYNKYGVTELICFVLALIAAYLLLVSPAPETAILPAIGGDMAASWPTLKKAYRDPRSEHWPAWGIITGASILGVFASDKFDLANLAFPVYCVGMTAAIFGLAFRGRTRY